MNIIKFSLFTLAVMSLSNYSFVLESKDSVDNLEVTNTCYVESISNAELDLQIKEQHEIIKEELLRLDKIEKDKLKTETFTLTFYTDLEEENSKYGPVTCNGEQLTPGMVANNILPQGTIIKTKEFGELIVSDRGGSNFNTRNRLDVFIPRNKGESNRKYFNRVNNMGIIKIKGIVSDT